jgi:DNA repair exonuclease SbcCD ATPase subunit
VNTPCDDCGFYPCRCEARAVSNERDALRANLESMEKGLAVECSAHMKTLADLAVARAESKELVIKLLAASGSLVAREADLDAARVEIARFQAQWRADADVLLDADETQKDLDAAMKLLERALNDRQHPGGSWADQCEDLINAITQKRGG